MTNVAKPNIAAAGASWGRCVGVDTAQATLARWTYVILDASIANEGELQGALSTVHEFKGTISGRREWVPTGVDAATGLQRRSWASAANPVCMTRQPPLLCSAISSSVFGRKPCHAENPRFPDFVHRWHQSDLGELPGALGLATREATRSPHRPRSVMSAEGDPSIRPGSKEMALRRRIGALHLPATHGSA